MVEQSCPSTHHGCYVSKSWATTAQIHAQQQQQRRSAFHARQISGTHTLPTFEPSVRSPAVFFIRSDLDTNAEKQFTQMNKVCFNVAGLQASLHTDTLDKCLTVLTLTFLAKQNRCCYKATDNCHN